MSELSNLGHDYVVAPTDNFRVLRDKTSLYSHRVEESLVMMINVLDDGFIDVVAIFLEVYCCW